MNIEARPICGAGGLPRTQFRTGKSGLSHQPLQHSLHLERGPRALAPRSRYSLASSPAAIYLNDVAPSACSSAFGGAIPPPARCWRAAADRLCILLVGITPRSPPSFVPRALAAVIAAFVCKPNTRRPRRAVEPVPVRRLPGISSTSTRRHRPGASVTFVALQSGVG